MDAQEGSAVEEDVMEDSKSMKRSNVGGNHIVLGRRGGSKGNARNGRKDEGNRGRNRGMMRIGAGS